MENKKSKLYTKTGDKGISGLYNGTRVDKDSIYFECLGDIDELNSNLGLVKAFWREEYDKMEIKLYNAPGAGSMFYKTEKCLDTGKYYEWFILSKYIQEIQCNLMDISTHIATPIKINNEKENLNDWLSKIGLNKEIITNIEKNIDRLDSIVPPIKNFVVPSGNRLISQIHVCRSIARRCERRYVSIGIPSHIFGEISIIKEQLTIPLIYLNRLSDYLFVLSRFVGMTLEVEEDLYCSNRK